MEIQYKLILTGASFILILISGFFISKIGKPYNPIAFNIHKFFSLAVLVYTIGISIHIFKGAEAGSFYYLLPIIILISLGAFITGGILSAKDEVKQIIITYHKIASILILIAALILIVIPLTK